MKLKKRIPREVGRPAANSRATPDKSVEDPFVVAALVRKGVQETVALERERGEVFRTPADRVSPYFRKSILAVLLERGEIDAPMKEAGERYGTHYRFVYDVGRHPSCLERYAAAAYASGAAEGFGAMLRRARNEGLSGHWELIAVCDDACGGRQSLPDFFRFQGRLARKARLTVALARLREHYAGRWAPADDDFAGYSRAEWWRMAQTIQPEITEPDFDALWSECGMKLKRARQGSGATQSPASTSEGVVGLPADGHR